jgi:hypothetical protein
MGARNLSAHACPSVEFIGEKPDCTAAGSPCWVEQGQVLDFEDPESFRRARHG